MNILKTPHQKLLEEAGAMPQTPGMLKTPRQLLFEESGMLPKYKKGKKVKKLSVQDMKAELSVTPKYAQGGKTETPPDQALAKVFNAIFS